MFIKKINEMLNMKADWKAKYEEKCKESDAWESKYNKLRRQLNAILEETKK